MKNQIMKLIKNKKYVLIHKPIEVLSDKYDPEVRLSFKSI